MEISFHHPVLRMHQKLKLNITKELVPKLGRFSLQGVLHCRAIPREESIRFLDSLQEMSSRSIRVFPGREEF
jgi:hypothetical protein